MEGRPVSGLVDVFSRFLGPWSRLLDVRLPSSVKESEARQHTPEDRGSPSRMSSTEEKRESRSRHLENKNAVRCASEKRFKRLDLSTI